MKIRVIVRISESVYEALEQLVFSRYPKKEWGSFFLFGCRKSGSDLVITISELLPPTRADMDSTTAIVRFNEPYIVRAAMAARQRGLCVGVVHSHPEGYRVFPSPIDDDMDQYFAEYFTGFAPENCYFSLIIAKDELGRVSISGRGVLDDDESRLASFIVVGSQAIRRYSTATVLEKNDYRERLVSLIGEDSARRLSEGTVAIIGCSGTGSPAAHVLARAGVGNFILVDPQRLAPSNVERVHGSFPAQFDLEAPYKVASLRDLIKQINPDAKVTCIVGNILQPLARDHVVKADLALGCTDSHHGRVALSELAYRYLTPSIDVGVKLDSESGRVTAELGQVTIYAPELPCVHCLAVVNGRRMSYELMSEAERNERRHRASEARARGDNDAGYWVDFPEIHTVGHLATLGGALVASYAIGWLTGKFKAPDQHFQFDILAERFGYVPVRVDRKLDCVCSKILGFSDQGAAYSLVTPPAHWPEPFLLDEQDRQDIESTKPLV